MGKCFLVWKIYWSESGYRGWDRYLYERWYEGRVVGSHRYVREHGFGHEWWNFYEGFSEDYYYGYAPPIHSMRPTRCPRFGAIFFISLNPFNGAWYLVGVYGLGKILDKQEISIVLMDHVPKDQATRLAPATKSELSIDHGTFLLKAPKKYSTVLPRPMPLKMEEDVGVRFFGQAWFKYIDDEGRAVVLLEKAIEYVEKLAGLPQTRNLWADPSVALERLRNLYRVITGSAPPEPHATGEAVASELLEGMLAEDVVVPERVVEDAVAHNLGIVEEGLELVARQQSFPTGRADIVARGRDGALVIIEVKAGRADDSSLA